eukprot:CAMPEP_0185729118 /NCGR_PEP_ID=MMETSP1171-20130828/4479_1 /TAXON_ID=374046 /ORGANISM="Helicotheca tamensis, Strain CCMP826" /LENGTH=251 /DNA_ID=CAMNT_0028397895 /DNA_START=37 /DNA_END=789 /DNA_ORIENTATION=-
MTEVENTLFKLLNEDSLEKQSDHDAIITEINRNPHSAALRYNFTLAKDKLSFKGENAYPLHQAILLRANIRVVQSIYNSYPPAIEYCEKGSDDEIASNTALQIAIVNASTDVILFLLDKWPEASRKKDWYGYTPLHLACKYSPSTELVTALLEHHPDAIREKSYQGHTPLHLACSSSKVQPKVILTLIEKWPQATQEECEDDLLPYYYYVPVGESDTIESILICITKLCGNTEENKALTKASMDFFVEIEW